MDACEVFAFTLFYLYLKIHLNQSNNKNGADEQLIFGVVHIFIRSPIMKKIYIPIISVILFCFTLLGQQTIELNKNIKNINGKVKIDLLKETHGENLRIFQHPLKIKNEDNTFNDNFVIKKELVKEWYNSSWVDYINNDFSYDSKWNLIEINNQTWKSAWVDNRKYSYKYDNENNLIEMLDEEWFVSGNIWRNMRKYLYSYDSLNNLIIEISKKWESNDSTWQNNLKYAFTYDTIGRLEEEICYNWWINDDSWKFDKKRTFSYNSFNKITEELNFAWNDSAWINIAKMSFNYDMANNLIEWLYQSWTEEKWENEQKKVYTFDSSNNLIEEVRLNWSNIINEWMNYLKYNSTYDTDNNKIETIQYEWNDNNGQWSWKNYFQFLYTYDQIVNIKNFNFINNNFVKFKKLPKGVYFDIPHINNQNLILHIYNIKGRKIGVLKGQEKEGGVFFNFETIKISSNIYIITLYDNKMTMLNKGKLVKLR